MAGTRVIETAPQRAAVVRGTVALTGMAQAQREARAALAAAGLGQQGPALTVWRPPQDGLIDYAPGVLLAEEARPQSGVDVLMLPAGRVATRTHEGGYEGLPAAWGQLFADCAAQGLVPAGLNWEVYAAGDAPAGAELYALLR